MKELIIPKEKAVFWLDKHGYWNNEHGKFQNKKIIEYFHSSIKRDSGGYYVGQNRDEIMEKVYFPYEDTALFVFTVVKAEKIILVLNTGTEVELEPQNLYAKADSLYQQSGEDQIKFTDKALMKISDLLTFEGENYFITVKQKVMEIPQR